MIYLDYAGSTPVLPELLEHYNSITTKYWGNPSAIHPIGRLAKSELELSRLKVLDNLGVSRETHNLVFTSNITEANHLAIQAFKPRSGEVNEPRANEDKIPLVRGQSEALGVARGQAVRLGGSGEVYEPPDPILYSNLEHDSILKNINNLEEKNRVELDLEGFIDLADLEAKITNGIKLICIQSVNNEIGTIQPLKEIRVLVDKINLIRGQEGVAKLYIFSDSAQAPNWLNLKEIMENVDILSLSSSKIYAPKGVGCLVYKKEINLDSEVKGGTQESGIRAGTENVAGISTFTKALEISQNNLEINVKNALNIRDHLASLILQSNPEITINGFFEQGDFKKRAANNLNIFIPKINTDQILTFLSLQNVCVSSGSNCQSGATKESLLIKEIGNKQVGTNLRISLGILTTKEEIIEFAKILSASIQKLAA
jgi:cysteine desulfurase